MPSNIDLIGISCYMRDEIGIGRDQVCKEERGGCSPLLQFFGQSSVNVGCAFISVGATVGKIMVARRYLLVDSRAAREHHIARSNHAIGVACHCYQAIGESPGGRRY